jgi:spore coat polysaccharide biosynthesis predicted glycosyltransferase SpsG
MRVAFRAGLGRRRMRRCLALASAMKEAEPASDIVFVTHAGQEAEALEAGFGTLDIGVAGAWEAEEAAEALGKDPPDLAVLDKGDADESYLSALRRVAPLAVFDEKAMLRRYDADAIVNPSLNAHLAAYPPGTEAELLLGTEFIPLPPSLDAYAEQARQNPESARKVLVCLSGRDVLRAVEALKALDGNFSATISLEPGFGYGEQLASEIGLDPRFITLTEPDPSRRFASSDLAIAGPELLAEILFFSLPAILVGGEADAQAEYAARSGMARYLPAFGAQSLSREAEALMGDAGARGRMSARMEGLVDGLGRYRLAAELKRICRGESL